MPTAGNKQQEMIQYESICSHIVKIDLMPSVFILFLMFIIFEDKIKTWLYKYVFYKKEAKGNLMFVYAVPLI